MNHYLGKIKVAEKLVSKKQTTSRSGTFIANGESIRSWIGQKPR
jgi:hypothetical protein